MVVFIDAFVCVGCTVDTNDTAPIAYPVFECLLLFFGKEDAGVIIQYNYVDVFQAYICEYLTVTGLRKIPVVFFG